MRRLTLKWRIVAYATLVHIIVAVAGGFVLLLNAQRAVHAEITAAQDSAVTLIEQLAEPLAQRAGSGVSLAELSDRIVQPRHVSIVMVPIGGGLEISPKQLPASDEDIEDQAPDWFLSLVSPDIETIEVPLVVSGQAVGRAEVSALPQDEANEVWEDVRGLSTVWAASTFALLGLITIVIGRALAPINRLRDALHHLEAGDYAIKAAEIDNQDLKPIGVGIDQLAQALRTAEEDRHRLTQKVLHLRDAEREELARELHDELGPCLFGLTVEVDAMRQNPSEILRSVDAVDQLVSQIRTTNSRILNTLRPQTIGQLPLTDVIADLIARFSDTNTDVVFDTALQNIEPPIDESRDLTVYRIIQEAVTNALRHGPSNRIEVRLALQRDLRQSLLVEVLDDGPGLGPDWQEGRGLIGMRERLHAMNGTLCIQTVKTGGTKVQAVLPTSQVRSNQYVGCMS